jgi:hypothetical protein
VGLRRAEGLTEGVATSKLEVFWGGICVTATNSILSALSRERKTESFGNQRDNNKTEVGLTNK